MGVVGLAVLYAAFAVVAVWLLGELLLQHRAEPHWRGLALLGFLVLVAGVALGSVPLIAVGVLAFGAGQFLVTRSVRTGRAHWSLRAADGALPGALAGLPLLATVFPAGPAPAGPPPQAVERVGEVGPVEPPTGPTPGYGTEQAPEWTSVEYVEQQPSYQPNAYDYAPQPQPGYVSYDYGWQDAPEQQQSYPQQYQAAEYEQQQYAQQPYQQPYEQQSYDPAGYPQQPYPQPGYEQSHEQPDYEQSYEQPGYEQPPYPQQYPVPAEPPHPPQYS